MILLFLQSLAALSFRFSIGKSVNLSDISESDVLPEARKVDFLYAVADGVYVRSTKKRKHIEVAHSIMYEGWEKNGRRVSLKGRKVLMTTQSTDDFWAEVQAFAANEYDLRHT